MRTAIATTVISFLVVLSSGASTAAADGALPPINTVFIILEENEDWSGITPEKAPYIHTQLLPRAAHATQYFAPPKLRPSLPNYIWLEAGDNLGIRNNEDPKVNHRSTPDHLVRYLDNAGISWKSYQEDIAGDVCPLEGFKKYAPKHNPMVYFDDVTGGNDPRSVKCIEHNRPYSELERDLRENTVARYNFITPNLCNDMHDCGVTRGDTWLSAEVPKILESAAYKNGGAIFITFDEPRAESEGPIGMIVISPYAKKGYSSQVRFDHSSTLRTMQEIFGVMPLLRNAATAVNLSDLFVSDYSFDTERPVTEVISPKKGEVVRGAMTVRASATDNVGVTHAELYADGALVASTRYPPYKFLWNASTVPNGEHTLTVRAYDAARQVGESAPVRIMVEGGR